MPQMLFDRSTGGSRMAAAADAIRELRLEGTVRLMEVCGTHTMAIAANGIKSLMPDNVKLISGPGCPVCVTDCRDMDRILELSSQPGITVASYGDMIRVPGSRSGDTLARRRALGADVRVVYSPMDAVELAQNEPKREIVFLGVGFETTAPGTAAALLTAAEKKLRNFSVLSLLKSVEPALRTLMTEEDFHVQGLLCPGHVASVIGEKGFRFLPEEFGIPAVIAGFEPEDILTAIYRLLKQIASGESRLENEYRRAVSANGNLPAQRAISACFDRREDVWRGLGRIPFSGFGISDQWKDFDAEEKFGELIVREEEETDGISSRCRCGDIIAARAEPEQCPFFGTRCTPEDPVGPCMVSGEGACAAAYKYMDAKWMR